jgi:invasion protein IalB
MQIITSAGLAGLAFMLIVPATAQDAVAVPQRPWQVACVSQAQSADLQCSVSQSLVAAETRQRIISVNLVGGPAGPTMTLSLPHGLNLPAGVTVGVDDSEPRTFPILTADQNGSYAEFTADDDLVNAMKRGTLLKIGVSAHGGDVVNFELSLSGFGEAVVRL